MAASPPLLTVRDLTFGYGTPPLLEGVDFRVDAGDRLALLGRNGSGKSTLLKLLAREMEPESGEISAASTLRVAGLTQNVPNDLSGTTFDVVARGLDDGGIALGTAVADYRRLTRRGPQSDAEDEALVKAQELLEQKSAWGRVEDAEKVISRLKLDADVSVDSLSAGVLRRVLLARALASDPQVLLLDEPTNHLDIDSIEWLEKWLLKFPGAVLFVNHDRAFVRALSTRVLDLDRGHLTLWDCDYGKYVERKEELLHAEEKHQKEFDRKLSEEEKWIRKGVKERRTRNQGRVRALKKMRDERRARRNRPGALKVIAQEAQKSGRLVLEAKSLTFSYGDRKILDAYSTTVVRGDKIGIIGPNGAGKSTLIRLLLGELEPDEGEVRHGTNLDIAYFDQLHRQIDENKTLEENVGDGRDSVQIDGRTRHIRGYLQDFLFSPAQARSRVDHLSGGERNRLMLAKLFSTPSNVLVLDEPTNDLDTESLELLEELLHGYGGTVLLVSHDRTFLNNVATSTIVFEDGVVREYVGGYDDWIRQRPEVETKSATKPKAKPKKTESKSEDRPKGLTYNEQKELTKLPERLEKLEAKKEELLAAMADPSFYEKPRDEMEAATKELQELESELNETYERWETLEEKNNR